jgi:methionyl aminopeptidase
MSIGSKKDLEALKRIGYIVALTVREMFAALRIGMTTAELDEVGRQVLERHGARSAPKLCYGFAGSTMISINEEVAHAIPGARRIQDGDMVNIDVSAELDGYFADTGSTRPVGNASEHAHRLCAASREALEQALTKVRARGRIAEVAKAIRRVAVARGFEVVENLGGHGVGRHLHEEPSHVPNFLDRRDRRRFRKGTVLTIEPFLSTGPKAAKEAPDGWTLVSEPGHLTAQFEHTVVVTENEPIILTVA